MKRIVLCVIGVLLLFGCATTKPAPSPETPADPRQDALRQGAQEFRAGLDALDDDDDVKAAEAFARAMRHVDAADAAMKASMKGAADQLVNVVDISGFEYAKKEAFSLLLTYLDMQGAYHDRDAEALQSLSLRFNAAYQETVQKTALEKQKRLEELGTEIAQKRDEMEKGAEPSAPDAFPVIYPVKKGDTLPSIASRHDIYNDSFMWPLIYKANRDQIKDPKELYAGQDLKIPRDMTVDEIVEARREAGAPEPDKIPKDAYIPKGKKK